MTDYQSNNRNGTQPSEGKLQTAGKSWITAVVTLLVTLLTSCAGTGGTVTTGTSKASTEARCAGWPEGTYSVEKDSPETVAWFGVYYRVGKQKKCWK